jgi:hypothetical protein
VVVLSAHPDASRVPAWLAVAAFTKPADPVELERAIRTYAVRRLHAS